MIFLFNHERVIAEFVTLYKAKASLILKCSPDVVHVELELDDSGKLASSFSADMVQLHGLKDQEVRDVLAGLYAEHAPIMFERLADLAA